MVGTSLWVAPCETAYIILYSIAALKTTVGLVRVHKKTTIANKGITRMRVDAAVYLIDISASSLDCEW